MVAFKDGGEISGEDWDEEVGGGRVDEGREVKIADVIYMTDGGKPKGCARGGMDVDCGCVLLHG